MNFTKRLDEIIKSNKADINFDVLIDNTQNVRRSLSEVKETLVISFTLRCAGHIFLFQKFHDCHKAAD